MQLCPERLEIKPCRGGLALNGQSLLTAHSHFTPHTSSGQPPHVTLLTATEYKALKRPLPAKIPISLDRIYVLGSASSRRDGKLVQWLVVVWNHADRWRQSMGLPRKEYHITLTEENDHGVSKGIGSLFKGMSREDFVDKLMGLGADGIDHVIVACRDELDLVGVLSYKLAD